MLRLLAPSLLLAALVTPALAADAPPAAAPAAATTPVPEAGAAAPCECGGPGKCCGQAAPVAAVDSQASGPSCGCAAAKRKARRAPR